MFTLILGGARSGKSRYAQSLCLNSPEVFYLATAPAGDADEEMNFRIARHRRERPAHWKIIEEPLEIAEQIRKTISTDSIVLVDCVTVWLSNLMWEYRAEPEDEIEKIILRKVDDFASAARQSNVVAVSNEVGGGIVPDNRLGRSFRDLQGLTNQLLAREAERVVLVIAGLPLILKG
ncbi:MAG TPA: bifunctional adenosylcobinamide kinase/adenosylcobinamide-phosphate guanylyltransferase [Pyrinomonadaceae bacterium]|nr:bifunctional adenosylcobinamide kinase/adenosylcobinamide-phosphate guanylyltransferase [Pyrinomonadaceae bacterium]